MAKRILPILLLAGVLFLLISFRNKPENNPIVESDLSSFDVYCKNFYQELHDTNLNYECFKISLTGFQNLLKVEKRVEKNYFTIIDYSKPSKTERLFIIDMKKQTIKLKSLVSHGKNSGLDYAESFSDNLQSYKSSIGFYLTGGAYSGKHGYSLRLEGLEPGYNSNALKRAIVLHPANYVSKYYIEKYGRIGRSYGCPAVPPEVNAKIINLIKDGTCLFVYYPDRDYLAASRYFNDVN